MPSYAADKIALRPPANPVALFGLSPIDRESIGNLVGHTLARIEREFDSSNIEIVPRKQNPHGRPTRNFEFVRCVTKSATIGALAKTCLSQSMRLSKEAFGDHT